MGGGQSITTRVNYNLYTSTINVNTEANLQETSSFTIINKPATIQISTTSRNNVIPARKEIINNPPRKTLYIDPTFSSSLPQLKPTRKSTHSSKTSRFSMSKDEFLEIIKSTETLTFLDEPQKQTKRAKPTLPVISNIPTISITPATPRGNNFGNHCCMPILETKKQRIRLKIEKQKTQKQN